MGNQKVVKRFTAPPNTDRLTLLGQAAERRMGQEKFRRRKHNFMKTGNSIGKDCGAKIYVIIEKGEKTFTFKSVDDPSWPPSQEELELKLKVEKKTSANFATKYKKKQEEKEHKITASCERSITIPTLPSLRAFAWPEYGSKTDQMS